MSRTISQGKNKIYNPYDIETILIIIFLQLPKLKKKIKVFHKHFSDYVKPQCNNCVLIQPTDNEEIAIIISPRIMCKSTGPIF